MSLDWLIVGGGIHGVHIAARLIGEGDVAHDRLRVLDPSERLLERWNACTTATGMTHLRSPAVHQLDANPYSLYEYADEQWKDEPEIFVPPYNRPSLELFNAHCKRVVEAYDLDRLHIRDRAVACTVDCDAVTVQSSDGSDLCAHNVVLAIGASEQPLWPTWAPKDHPHIHHVFQPEFDGWPTERSETVAVIGGGISAVQVALRLCEEGHRAHLISRHALRKHQFDSEPGWLGPKYLEGFGREGDLDRRRTVIVEARHRGSVPPDVQQALQAAIEQQRITWHEAEIKDVHIGRDEMSLVLTNADEVNVERMLLSTGFSPERPGGSMIDELIASASLPCAQCGYPVVDSALHWHPRIRVTGPLAELEIGPASRNIVGARFAADRIVSALRR